jgi:hypothetical protein
MKNPILIIAVVVGCLLGSASTLFIAKMIKPKIVIPSCPACNCPPSTEIKLQELDMDNLRRIKGDFNYNPSLSNVTIKIEAKDSVMMKQILKSVK